MSKLIGFAHASGTVVFERRDNPWAFRRLDDELKHGQENRILFDPARAEVEVRPSEKCGEEELPWLPRLRQLIATSTRVYLERHDQLLRFRQAIHELDANRRIITLGSQHEVMHYGDEHWRRLSHFYATRRDGFRFDLEKVVARDKDQGVGETSSLELQTRFGSAAQGGALHVTFDATGSHVHNDLILWRKTVPDGQTGRFTPSAQRIHLQIANFKQPFTFCEDYHADFHSRWYVFTQAVVEESLRKALRSTA